MRTARKTRQKTRQGILRCLITAACVLSILLTGCDDTGDSAGITNKSAPTRVVNQIIANACLGEEEEATEQESLTTGQVKGLSKVKDGYGIPYDEYAKEYVCPPVPITDSSYEANKNRGIGYTGIEEDHDGGSMYPGLTEEETKYGCNMRWEYCGWSNGHGVLGEIPVDGYLNFLRGNGSGHYQYLAIHALKSDKWCICAPYDYGPATGLSVTGSEHYGRIGGVTAQVAQDLQLGGGDCPDENMTEWWWVENSEQVKVGPINDLSSLTGGNSSSSNSSNSNSNNSNNNNNNNNNSNSSTSAAVNVVRGATVALANDSNGTSVSIEPVNANSFVNKTDPSLAHGSLPKDRIKYIVMHDTEAGTTDGEAIVQAWVGSGNGVAAHFVVEKNGRIIQAVPPDQVAWHAGDAGSTGNEKFGLEFIPEFKDYPVPPVSPSGQEGRKKDGQDYLMNYYSLGIEIVHEHNEGPYPEEQLNALDKLVAYIDQYVGSKAKIIDHKTWSNQPDSDNIKQDCSDDFPLQNYQETRNHVGVRNIQEAEEAKSKNLCSDEDDEDDTSAAAARIKIAKAAVSIAGTASPDDSIKGGAQEKPTDPRLSTYVGAKEKGYPGDSYWASCDRTAAAAISLSGVDPGFPVGPCDVQESYCSQHPEKWKHVGEWRTGDSCNRLQPGDVLVMGGHTKIYTGYEYPKEKFPNTNGNMMQGSFGQHYAHISEESQAYDSRTFSIFRFCAGTSGGGLGSSFDELFFDQNDPRWRDEMYGAGKIGPTGCGLCSAAHCVSICIGEEVNPSMLAKQMRQQDPSYSFASDGHGYGGTFYGPWSNCLNALYGDRLTVEQIDISQIKSELEQGHPCVFGITAGGSIKCADGSYRITGGGHVMSCFRTDGSSIFVKGSSEAAGGIPGGCIEYNPSEWSSLMSACQIAYRFVPKSPVSGLKGSKKSSKTKKKKKKSTGSSGTSTSNVKRFMFVGDSRTNQMGGYLRESLANDFTDGEIIAGSKSPDGKDEYWIAKGSMGFDWFRDVAVPLIDQNVQSGDAIIIWMGVNGAPMYTSEYADLVNAKEKEWRAKGALTFYASVGPENVELAARYGMGGAADAVPKFNEELKSKLSSDVKWIDVYEEIKDNFGSPDGVHYDQPTYQRVYDCMVKGATGGATSSGGAEEEEEEEEEEPKYLRYEVYTP